MVNEWRPISKYFEEKGKHDWALVQFEETNPSKFRGIPHLVEYRDGGIFGKGWYSFDADEDGSLFDYLNTMCKAIAFFEWIPYEEVEK